MTSPATESSGGDGEPLPTPEPVLFTMEVDGLSRQRTAPVTFKASTFSGNGGNNSSTPPPDSICVADIFPPVSLNFAGGASMFLNPQDYLLQQNNVGDTAVWCIGFQNIQNQGITILGDLVRKDKIFVYDLAGQRIGWTNYNCSLSVNVSATRSSGRSEYVNAGEFSDNAVPQIPSLNYMSETF